VELYILDAELRRDQVVDRFESLIWTERFDKWGDFELKIHSTPENRNRFPVGTRLLVNESYEVMTVESIEDGTDADGRVVLTIKGRTLEKILDDRLARGTMDDLTTAPKWSITDVPADIARKIFHDICVLGVLDPADVIPGIVEGSIFPPDTIDEPADPITFEMDPMTVYSAQSQLCEAYDMGFRMVRNPTTLAIHFDVYMGSDRTTKQTDLPAVVFSENLGNLSNTNEFTSIVNYKNVAYVLSPVGTEIVYAADVDPSTTGFERNVLVVKADDIKDEDPLDASAKMIQRAREELAKHRVFSGFDGEISKTSRFKYGVNYFLGDIVELRNDRGFATDMQVVEQILISDKEGDRQYPTLAVRKFITPGSWLGYGGNKEWDDMTTEEWDDLP
jgi:hypothetical protein